MDMCYAFRTGHSSNNVLIRSTCQSPWVSQEGVGVGVARHAYHLDRLRTQLPW